MRVTYRQFNAGPVVNLARNPRGTAYLGAIQAPKWENARWGGEGVYTLLTGVTGHPEGITTAVRYTTTAARNSHGFHLCGNPEGTPANEVLRAMPVQPGERITVSCWLRYTGTSTQGYGFRFRATDATGSAWIDSGTGQSSVSLPSGAWVRLSLTYTVPAGSSFVSLYVTNTNGIVDAINDTIDGTGLMVTRTPPPRANIASDPYATANTIPNNRFGWAPQWFGGGTAAGTTTQVVGATDGPNDIPTYLRKTWTATNTGYADIAYTHVNVNRALVSAGETYTISSYFRASKGWTVASNCRIRVEWFDGAGVMLPGTGAVLGANLPAVVSGTWHKLTTTVTAPTGAVTMRPFQLIYIDNPGAWTVGDTIDGTGLVVTRDNVQAWRYADGSSPGWKWLGAVNTSESAGYAVPG